MRRWICVLDDAGKNELDRGENREKNGDFMIRKKGRTLL